ncbi:MAG: hypothetical protein ACYTG0_01715 [Planctomycetota bacterium]|jgi:hypothetical protein
MKAVAVAIVVLSTLAAFAQAELVCERWAGQDVSCAHRGTLSVDRTDEQVRLIVDLSALPKETNVYGASLCCFTQDGIQPVEPARIVPGGGGNPLALERPWLRSFDATEAVRKARGEKLVLVIKRFEALQAEKSYLDLRYEGNPSGECPDQVTGVRAVHHDGQTFVIWSELPPFRPPKGSVFWVSKFSSRLEDNETAEGPGEGFLGYDRLPAISLATLRQLQGLASESVGRGVRVYRVREVPLITYRVYRHARPITSDNLKDAELLSEVEPFCGFDEKMRRISYRGEYLNQQEIPESIIPTHCYRDGTPLVPGEAFFAHTPTRPGKACYAATAALAASENTAVGPANATAAALEEHTAPLRPVFQRVQTGLYDRDPLQHWFLFWPARELSNVPRGPNHVIVTMPEDFPEGGPMAIGPLEHGGAFNLVNHSTKHAPSDALKLHVIQPNNLCYSDGLDTLKSFRESKIDYFSERYLLSLIHWCQDKWKPQSANLPGQMLHFGIRHPEIFGFLSFGGYTASYDYQWAPQGRGLRRLLGPRETAVTVDGLPAWDQFNVGWYVNTYPGRDIPFLYLLSGTGKDKGHTSEFGWQDDPRGWAGLRDGRQNFIAFWARSRIESYLTIPTMAWGTSLPAFSNCSLDNNPGNGDPADGDPYGQINGWLLWQTDDVVDEPDRWEMTVYLTADRPADACTVDVTPRHRARFDPKPGDAFRWTNTSVAAADVVQSGTTAADRWGLVTLENVAVAQGKNRIRITRKRGPNPEPLSADGHPAIP